MARPRSDARSGASPRSGQDADALRRQLYRPGADRAAVEAYLAAVERDAAGADAASAPGGGAVPPEAVAEPASGPPPPGRRPGSRWWRLVPPIAVAIAVPTVGIAVLLRPAPAPVPRPSATGPPVAPTTIDGLRGGSTLLVALPFRTSRVRVRLECRGRRARYGWTALGRDAQTQQFIPVLRHSGDDCTPGATYVGPLPGDVDALRILVTVDGPYALSVDPL